MDLDVELLPMFEDAFDELPREVRGLVGEAGTERAALPGLLRVGAVEVDLEQGLQRDPARRMTAGARSSLTAIAQRTMFARARPWVTTDTPAMPRSGADTYWS